MAGEVGGARGEARGSVGGVGGVGGRRREVAGRRRGRLRVGGRGRERRGGGAGGDETPHGHRYDSYQYDHS